MARIVLPIAGAIIGGYIGGTQGAQLGWAAGTIIAGVAFQETIKNRQPRIEDLKVTRGEYGHVLPYVEGAQRMGGWVAWASDRRAVETTTSEGGKGGPKVETTTITYEVDLLILLTCNEIAGVRRIWQDGELVWSRSDDSDFETFASSSAFARRVTVYTGAADQLPDPTYEAAIGTENAPAYRGRGSIFLEGWDLGSSGQIRNLTFEVCTALADTAVTEVVVDYTVDGSEEIGTPAFSPLGFDIHQPHVVGAEFVEVLRWQVGRPARRKYTYPVTIDTTGGIAPCEGTSDVSGVMLGYVNQATVDKTARWYHGTGAVTTLTLPYDINSSSVQLVFCKSGDHFVIGDKNSGGQKRLFRYGPTGGAYAVQSAELDTEVREIAIAGSRVYAVGQDLQCDRLYILNLSTLALIDTIDLPAQAASAFVFTDEAEAVYSWVGNGNLYRLNGESTWDVVMSGLSTFGGEVDGRRYGVSDGIFFAYYSVTSDLDDKEVSTARLALSTERIALDGIVERLCERSGVDSALVDASALAGKNTHGFALSQVMTTRAAIEMLGSTYFFEAAKSDGLLFVNRGGATVETIPYEDLGTVEAGAEPSEPLQIVAPNDIEVPAYIVVRYSNTLNDYQEGTESSDRLVTDSTETRVVEVPIAMEPNEAKQLAQVMATDVQSATFRVGPVAVQRRYASLVPTDPVLLTAADGSTFRVRIVKRDEAAGILTLEGVLDDATAINSEAVTDNDYTSTVQIRLPSPTEYQLLDIPRLRDVDDGPGFYAAFAGDGDNWRGAVLFGGDDDANLEQIVVVRDETVIGTCIDALGTWGGGNTVDIVNTVRVEVLGELSSVTRDQMLDGQANACAISSSGRWEILHFQNATLVGTDDGVNTYDLDTFLRYRKGTEGVVHGIGDTFVLLQTTGMRKVVLEQQRMDIERYYKAVSAGRPASTVPSEAFTWTGEIVKPLSPVNLRAADAGASTTFTWDRRSRLNGTFMTQGNDAPLGEDVEFYDVELRDGSDDLVDSARLSEAEWTVASTLASLAGHTLTVWQRSSTAGRGFSASLEL